jgi:hypothetical protein
MIYIVYIIACHLRYIRSFKLFNLYMNKFPQYKRICSEYIISLINDNIERNLTIKMYFQIYGPTEFYSRTNL